MDFLELVKKRYSTRKYASLPVKREDINECLEAARLAPSACNSQPWQFIIVDTPELKDTLSRDMLSGVYAMNTFVQAAPVLVVVVTDKTKWLTKVCNVVRDTKLYLIDIGIACAHFILRATELELGTCVMGWFNEKAVKKVLGISREKRVHIIIAMGYYAKDSQPKAKERKKISEMSYYAES